MRRLLVTMDLVMPKTYTYVFQLKLLVKNFCNYNTCMHVYMKVKIFNKIISFYYKINNNIFFQGDHNDEDVSALRQENLKLREEILRLKHAAGVQQSQPLVYSPPEPVPTESVYYMAIGLLIAILGVIIGKFVL